jgi:hypothetical protein
MVSPKTGLMVRIFAEFTKYYTYVYVISEEGDKLAGGMLSLEERRGDLVRVHCALGREGLTVRGGGFGPLIYYGAAMVAQHSGFRGIFSHNDERSSDATDTWERFTRRGFAHKEGEADVMTCDEARSTGLIVWESSESTDSDDV